MSSGVYLLKMFYYSSTKRAFFSLIALGLLGSIILIMYKLDNRLNDIYSQIDDLKYNQSINLLFQQLNASKLASERVRNKELQYLNLTANSTETIKLDKETVGIKLHNHSQEIAVTVQNFTVNEKSLPINEKHLVTNLNKNLNSDAEKVISMFKFVKSNMVWDYTHIPLNERLNSLEYLFGEGKGLCTIQAKVLCQLAQTAGYQSRLIEFEKPGYHVATEIFYDNAYHYFDPDSGYYVAKQDNVLSLEQIKENITALNSIEMRYEKDLIKRQIIGENKKYWNCNTKETNKQNLEIKLLPGMSFWLERNPLPPLSTGFRDRLQSGTFLGYFEDLDFSTKKNTVEFVSSFGFEWMKFVTDDEYLKYQINDGEIKFAEAEENGVVILSNYNKTLQKKANKVTIKNSKKIKSYILASKFNPSSFPFLQNGLNNIVFSSPTEKAEISLAYW